jgi:thiamine pyrophosphate-dependent acetolactate synthase large subunit-like protein
MIDAAAMFKVFQSYRGDALVVPGRGAPHWTAISAQPKRDIPLGDPAMGGHAAYAFGLALAQPDEKVILFDSEGDLLMNLGVLATIADQQPRNFYHFLLDNECYATTGGQPVPNAKLVDYATIAKGAGYPAAYAFDELDALGKEIEHILSEPGPVLVAMKIIPEVENTPIGLRQRRQRRDRREVMRTVQAELGVQITSTAD